MTDDTVFALIVEDQPDSAEIVARILAFNGRSYQSVASAEEALVILSVLHPQIIIADLALPQMSGWDLLGEVKTIPSLANIPMVAVTAYHSPNVERGVMEIGFDAFLPKPLDTATFMQTVDDVIEETSRKSNQL